MNDVLPAADWYPDPLSRHEYRYWDGTTWTENVASTGVAAVDPIWTTPASTTLEEAPVTGELPLAVGATTVYGGFDATTGRPGPAEQAAHAPADPTVPNPTLDTPLPGTDPTVTEPAPGAPPPGGFGFLGDPATGPAPQASVPAPSNRAPSGRRDAGSATTGPSAARAPGPRPRTVPVRRRPSTGKAYAIILAGGLLAVVMGVYGSLHDTGTPRYDVPNFGFENFLQFKVWFTTLFVILAAFQALTSARMYGKIKVPKNRPRWLGDLHRLLGTLILLVSLPIAYHCLWRFGFTATDLSGEDSIRVLLHSIAGCAFYGAYLTKVLAVRVRRLPRWMLPYAGGAVFATLILLFASSSAYVFTHQSQFPGF